MLQCLVVLAPTGLLLLHATLKKKKNPIIQIRAKTIMLNVKHSYEEKVTAKGCPRASSRSPTGFPAFG